MSRAMRSRCPLAGVLVLLASGLLSCVSSGARPAPLPDCRDDAALLGTWRSFRTSQVGPAWMTTRFDCGCVYRTSVQLLWMRFGESGHYRIEAGEVVFVRPSGSETRWPYRFEGGRLAFDESAEETHLYRRTARRSCDDSKVPPPASGAP